VKHHDFMVPGQADIDFDRRNTSLPGEMGCRQRTLRRIKRFTTVGNEHGMIHKIYKIYKIKDCSISDIQSLITPEPFIHEVFYFVQPRQADAELVGYRDMNPFHIIGRAALGQSVHSFP